MPGKYGDILWSLPTVRAISETFGVPVDLIVSADYSDHRDLLLLQDYVRDVLPWSSWQLPPSGASPWSPFDDRLHYLARDLPDYDRVFHLGYRSKPNSPLPAYIYGQLTQLEPGITFRPLDILRPWIHVDAIASSATPSVSIGWSSTAVEWKHHVTKALKTQYSSMTFVPVMPSVQGQEEWKASWCFDLEPAADWVDAAGRVAQSCVFVGCCSALHVLACAMGKSVVVAEPDENRWDSSFYPYGVEGPRVRLVRGDDGSAVAAARLGLALDMLLGTSSEP
jgi:hypothetical protein